MLSVGLFILLISVLSIQKISFRKPFPAAFQVMRGLPSLSDLTGQQRIGQNLNFSFIYGG
jgi:hypothetical protein